MSPELLISPTRNQEGVKSVTSHQVDEETVLQRTAKNSRACERATGRAIRVRDSNER